MTKGPDNEKNETKNGSGVFHVIEEKSHIDPFTSPHVPEMTRLAFHTLGGHMDRMKKFFGFVFYHVPRRQTSDMQLIESLQHALFNEGIEGHGCYVGHLLNPSEGVQDELIISSPEALLIYQCEQQMVTRPHEAPSSSLLKIVHPDKGLYIQPGSVFTSNFGSVRFDGRGVYEKRDSTPDWSRSEEKIWKQHVARWRLTEQQPGPDRTRQHTRTSILDFLKWKNPPPKKLLSTPVFVPYDAFQKRVVQAMGSLNAGLSTINRFIEDNSGSEDDHVERMRF